MNKENLIDKLFGIYGGGVSRREKEALKRRAKPINLDYSAKGVVIKPDEYRGVWHQKEKVGYGSGTSRVTYSPSQKDDFLIMSPDVLATQPELKEPGNHPRVILIQDGNIRDVRVELSLYWNTGVGFLPSICVHNEGVTPIGMENIVNDEGKPVDFGEGVTVNSHSLAMCVPFGGEGTKILLNDVCVTMLAANRESIRLVMKREVK